MDPEKILRAHLKKAVLIVGHGSKLRGFQAAMIKVERELKKDGRFGAVSCAYLEITPPSVPDAIDRLVQKGVREIFVLPYFLLLGRHTQEDIPRIVKEAGRRHRSCARIRLCPYLGYDPGLVPIIKKRVRQARKVGR